MRRMSRHHHMIRRPLELFAFRLWPLTLVALWVIVLATGGLIQEGELLPQVLTMLALVTAFLHFLRPLNTTIRYLALATNEVAILNRMVAYLFYDDPPLSARVEWLASGLWGTIAMAKLSMFMVTTVIVGYERARKRAGCDGLG